MIKKIYFNLHIIIIQKPLLFILKMDVFMKVNGMIIYNDMGMVNINGKMVLIILVIGRKIKHMDLVN